MSAIDWWAYYQSAGLLQVNLITLIDAFVEKVNAQPREPMPFEEVPDFLREDLPDDLREGIPNDWASWRIVKRDNAARIDALQAKLGKRFPPSFRYFVSSYCFPAFEFGPVMYFANTGQDNFWELGKRLFTDPHMSPQLLEGGFIQFGEPYFYNYDPVCFDTNGPSDEYPIVQLDHELILQFSELKVVKEISRSFIELLTMSIERPDA